MSASAKSVHSRKYLNFCLTSMARQPHLKKKSRTGGRRDIVAFDVQKQVDCSEHAIKHCLWFECACEEKCLWKCACELPNPTQVIKDYRSGRFAGKKIECPTTTLFSPIFFFLFQLNFSPRGEKIRHRFDGGDGKWIEYTSFICLFLQGKKNTKQTICSLWFWPLL